MTVSTGFIVLNGAGAYAREYEVQTHGCLISKIEWVSYINRATVFINKVYAVRRNKELSGRAMLFAQVTRVVTILGEPN